MSEDLSLQTQTVNSTAQSAKERRPVGRPPSLGQRLAISELAAKGHSEAQIAKALSLTPSQCREALQDARSVLEASAVTIAGDWLTASHIAGTKGDHRPAKDLLDRLHVTEATPADTPTPGVTVQVMGFTLPGLPLQVQANGQLTAAPQPAPLTLPAAARLEERE